jgi:predicted dehydrogenase
LTFCSAKDLADADEVDPVVISVKVSHHRDLVMPVLDAGKAVLCEWPLGRSPDESRLLTHEAAERDISSAVADLSPPGLVAGLPGQHPGVDR